MSSLTSGEGLLKRLITESLIQMGKEIYPQIKDAAVRVSPPAYVSEAIERVERTSIGLQINNRLMIKDPWDEIAEKLLGYKFPKKGMASYFVAYMHALSVVCENDRMRQELSERTEQVRNKRNEVEAKLNLMASSMGCKVSEMSKVAKTDPRYIPVADSIDEVFRLISEIDIDTENLVKESQNKIELSYALLSRVALLDSLIEWPKNANRYTVGIFLLQKLVGFANKSDFAKVRQIAETFLTVPANLNKIALLGQGKKV